MFYTTQLYISAVYGVWSSVGRAFTGAATDSGLVPDQILLDHSHPVSTPCLRYQKAVECAGLS